MILKETTQQLTTQPMKHGLINGDAIRKIFRSDGQYFVVTEQGDLLHTRPPFKKLHQVMYKAGKLVENETSRVESCMAQDLKFPKEREGLVNLVKRWEKKSGKQLLHNPNHWYVAQVLNKVQKVEAQETEDPIDPKILEPVLKRYVPTKSPITPFSRYEHLDDFVFRRRNDTEKNYEPINAINSYYLSAYLSAYLGDPLPKPTAFGQEIIYDALSTKKRSQIMKDKVLKDHVDNLRLLRRSSCDMSGGSLPGNHGINQGIERHEQMSDAKFSAHGSSFRLDSQCDEWYMEIQKNSSNPFVREPLFDSEPQKTSYFRSKVRKKRWVKGVVSQMKSKDRFMRGLRRRLTPYLIGATILLGGFLNHTSTNSISKQEISSQLEEMVTKKPVVQTLKKVLQKTNPIIIAKPGDCYWKLAQRTGMVEKDASNLEKFRATNKLLELNNKATIGAWEKMTNRERMLRKDKNPHLLFIGDQVMYTPKKTKINNKTEKISLTSTPILKQRYEKPILTPKNATSFSATYTHPSQGHTHKIEQNRSRKSKPYLLPNNSGRESYIDLLNQVVRAKNNHQKPSAQFQSIDDYILLCKDAQHTFQSKQREGPVFQRYEHQIACPEMQHAINHYYVHSKKNLSDVASELTNEYGMHISPSTISRRARLALGLKKRPTSS